MSKDKQALMYWHGRHVDELSREELLDAIAYLGAELERVRADRERWAKAGDPLKYLMQNRPSEAA